MKSFQMEGALNNIENVMIVESASDSEIKEALDGTPFAYGVNRGMNDSKILKTPGGNFYTFFHLNGLFYCVVIDQYGECGFGPSEKYSLNPRDYEDDIISADSALKVFSVVIYVLLEMTIKTGFRNLKFEPKSAALNRLYGMMMRNPIFLQQIARKGWYPGTLSPGIYRLTKDQPKGM